MTGESDRAKHIREMSLCHTCKYKSEVRSDKGSVFLMCKYSEIKPAYPKYPPLPVLSCNAYEKKAD